MYWCARILLGVLITGAGIGKLLDVPGFAQIIHTYKTGLPTWLIWPLAIAVIAVEMIIGLAILSGRFVHRAAFAAIIMHGGYVFLLTTTLLRGVVIKDCGCFGTFLARPLTWHSPLEDVILMGVSYLLFKVSYDEKR